jgi:hypothetical protein
VLVATDCLSEGVNLQGLFDTVVHYDLAWNPTRHEQREGRVDRYGQPNDTVRVLTYFGRNNPVDGVVLRVLQEKNKRIQNRLGIFVPVPMGSREVLDAIFEALVLRGQDEQLSLLEELPEVRSKNELLEREWEAAADREIRSRTIFAQRTINVDDVRREVEATRAAIGAGTDVEQFVTRALRAAGATVSTTDPATINLENIPVALRDTLGRPTTTLKARFALPVDGQVEYLARTHPFVEALAGYVADTSLDPLADPLAARCGAMRTDTVATRTTLFVTRMRFDVITRRRGHDDTRQLAEEIRLLAYEGSPSNPTWLDDDRAVQLLHAEPSGNVTPDQARTLVTEVIDAYDTLAPALEQFADSQAQALRDAHARVREGARQKGVAFTVETKPPVDVLGAYVLLPRPTL